jgi:formylglycine-generating enzyme required for sulfatase activity
MFSFLQPRLPRVARVRASLVLWLGLAVAALAFGNAVVPRLLARRPVLPPVSTVTTAQPAVEARETEDRSVANSVDMRLAPIPAGTFWMGSSTDDRAAVADERPRHEVTITRLFQMGICEVTRGQFRTFVRATGYRTEAERGAGSYSIDRETGSFVLNPDCTWQRASFAQAESHPVVCVSWNDAMAFCTWLSRKERKKYGLPTEAEWEHACRAGSRKRWHSGDMFEGLAEVANVADLTAHEVFPQWRWTLRLDDGYLFTGPVGSYHPNDWGLFDMHGNVAEWCADWYAAGYYGTEENIDPKGPAQGEGRVVRGGAWSTPPRQSRAAARAWHPPDYRSDSVGFRVCLRSGE